MEFITLPNYIEKISDSSKKVIDTDFKLNDFYYAVTGKLRRKYLPVDYNVYQFIEIDDFNEKKRKSSEIFTGADYTIIPQELIGSEVLKDLDLTNLLLEEYSELPTQRFKSLMKYDLRQAKLFNIQFDDIDNSIIDEMYGLSRVGIMKRTSFIGKMFGSSCVDRMFSISAIDEMHDLSRVNEMYGRSLIDVMYDDSLVDTMYDDSRINVMYGRSWVRKIYYESLVDIMDDVVLM